MSRLLLSFRFFPGRAVLALACAAGLGAPKIQAQVAEHPGAAIYRKLCADCHGAKGQGVMDKYDEPLQGNRSLEGLAKRIARTMPEDDVGACVGEDAKAVAAYIYDAFYSPQASARLSPPEFDLARLTIAQYRNAAADLIGRFRPGSEKPPGAGHGLKARYNGLAVPKPEPVAEAAAEPVDAKPPEKKDEKKKDPEKARFERTDGRVAFQYGAGSPDNEKLTNEEFSAHWEGSVFAETTGIYEFIVRTENGVRLWVNDGRRMLIDAWVSRGSDVREEKKSLFLIGGRWYPLVLDFFKFKEKTASIELQWKPPHGVLETIGAEHLFTERTRETLVVETAFPADDRSMGYERGTGISKEWDQATTEAAIQVAEYVDEHLEELAGVKAGAPERLEKLKQFGRRFAGAAFRRPLGDEEYARYVERQFAAAKTPELGLKRTILLALKSPRFLYPELPSTEAPDDYEVASRLALNLWDSLPDSRLLEAAAQGKLRTREQIAAQAGRMLPDARTKAKLRGFFHQWLELERAETISKDPKAFPEFDAAVLADLRSSLERFVEGVVWSERSDYRELLEADYLWLNARLAKLYGRSVEGDGFERVAFDPKERAGVVTHPYLLAALAHSRQTSPIHRGVFLTRNIVGMILKPPPMAVAFDDAKFDAHLTMREKVTDLTKNKSCMGCHGTINSLGFSLENYDAIGRWRTQEDNKTIDAASDFATDEGSTIRLTGARDVVKFAAESAAAHRAFIHQLFHHTAKQAVGVYGPDALEILRQGFAQSGFNLQKLLGRIATMAAARGLPDGDLALAQKPPLPSSLAAEPSL